MLRHQERHRPTRVCEVRRRAFLHGRTMSRRQPVDDRPLSRLGLWVVLGASMVVVLDFSIVNVALPQLSSALGLATTTAEWVVTAYALTFGGLLILGGRAADS